MAGGLFRIAAIALIGLTVAIVRASSKIADNFEDYLAEGDCFPASLINNGRK